MYNKVMLIGRLTRDPKSKTSSSGLAVSQFGLAVNRTKDDVDFFDLVAFGKTAEICTTYLTKGKLIFVEGVLKINSYEKDGVRVQRPEIIVNVMKMLSSKQAETKSVEDVEEIPF